MTLLRNALHAARHEPLEPPPAPHRDCRVCGHFRTAAHCMSALQCIDGLQFQSTQPIHLWFRTTKESS